MSEVMSKHWRILQMDPMIEKFVAFNSSITYRRSRNLRDILVYSYKERTLKRNVFGTKGPKHAYCWIVRVVFHMLAIVIIIIIFIVREGNILLDLGGLYT